jgi:hypothetical protein
MTIATRALTALIVVPSVAGRVSVYKADDVLTVEYGGAITAQGKSEIEVELRRFWPTERIAYSTLS